MAVKIITVKCPECGALLDFEEDRKQAFCSYCGTKILLHNENEHIYRHIDEAGVKQAETDRMVKMRQLEIEEKENERRRSLIQIWIVSTIVLTIVGVIGMVIDNEGLGICLLIAMCVALWGALFLMVNKKKTDK